jgi:AcrR family transcriptional regulator
MSKKLEAKDKVLTEALHIAEEIGYHKVTRDYLARVTGVSTATISGYFGTMVHLRRAIIGEAIAKRNLTVVAQALAMGDPRAKACSLALREAAARTLV